jgi:hypothetical protein
MKDRNVTALLDKFSHDIRSDEPCAADDQDIQNYPPLHRSLINIKREYPDTADTPFLILPCYDYLEHVGHIPDVQPAEIHTGRDRHA